MERIFGIIRSGQRHAAPLRRGGVLLLLAWVLTQPALGVTFTAALERDSITLGESVGFSLTFDGAQPEGTPNIPAVAGLQITYNGPSSQFSFVNGQVSSKVTHNFTVTPRQVGDYTIPALNVTVGGEKLATQPARLKVLKPGAPPPEAVAAGTQPAFLKLQLPKTNVYFGEVIAGEIQIYLRDGVQGISQFQFTGTPAEGFSVGKMAETQRRRVQIGNAIYTVIPIAAVFTPNKTGPLTIGPITASLVVELPAANGRRRDAFMDPFGMFNNNERKQLSLVADVETVQCLPLPVESKPADFNGAVGNYSMTVSVGPTNVAAGDPITVRVQIAGRGQLDAINWPEQTGWNNFKAYPPTTKVETTDPLGLQGTKTFEQIISPENPEISELPAFSFSFFDADANRYRTLTHPATKLVVRPGAAVVAPTVAATSKTAPETTPPQQDIVPIKQHLGAVTKVASSRILSPTHLVLNLTPVIAFAGLVVWRKRKDALANNPRLRRQLQVEAVIRSGLLRLGELASQNKSDDFFAELMHLLQEKLGERLDLPASAITEAVIGEKLRPRGIPDSTLDDLHELFQATNLARYAPVKSSQELAAIIPKLTNALRKLDQVKR